MEIEVFNAKGFEAGDFIKVFMNDGSEEVIELERGDIYMGSPDRNKYQTDEIIPGTPPCIVVQGNHEHPEGRGIAVVDVSDVILIKRS